LPANEPAEAISKLFDIGLATPPVAL